MYMMMLLLKEDLLKRECIENCAVFKSFMYSFLNRNESKTNSTLWHKTFISGFHDGNDLNSHSLNLFSPCYQLRFNLGELIKGKSINHISVFAVLIRSVWGNSGEINRIHLNTCVRVYIYNVFFNSKSSQENVSFFQHKISIMLFLIS